MSSKVISVIMGGILFFAVSCPGIAAAADSISGSLTGAPTYDRIFTGNVDPNCNAASTLSGLGVGVPYAVIAIYTPVGENLIATVNPIGTDIADTTLTLYCEPFDSNDARQNVIAYDDDDGDGLLSAFDGSEGAFLAPGNLYFLVLSLFAPGTMGGGNYKIDLGGDIMIAGTLTVSIAGTGSGRVTSSPAGIDCGADCLENYTGTTEITLTAAPDPGSAFDGWSNTDCVGNKRDCTVTVDSSGLAVTATFHPDQDGDGISDVLEDAGPFHGDGNQNGLRDSIEPNVATFPSVACGYVTLEAEVGATLHHTTFQGNPSKDDQPQGYTIPDCFFGFTVLGFNPGFSTIITLTLHQKHEELVRYLKYGATPDDPSDHWYVFAFDGLTGARIFPESGRTVINLYLKDGTRGDDDLDENGSITDIGAPATKGPQTGDIQGSGGGCFLSTVEGGSERRMH